MRKYKFRGKDKNTGKWVYGFYLEQDTYNMGSKNTKKDLLKKDAGVIVQNSKYDSGTVIDKETIGQYTGLKDKNGKEIYEGDIVKVFTNKKWRIGKIIYEHSGFTIDVTNNKELEYGRTSIIESLTEVIGNIYDNPELLEEGE